MSREEIREALRFSSGGFITNNWPMGDWMRHVTEVTTTQGPYLVVCDDPPSNYDGPEGWIIVDWRPAP